MPKSKKVKNPIKDEVEPKYELHFIPASFAEWEALDGSIKKPLKHLLMKRLSEPHVPGGALTGRLNGCYKIKLQKQGYRLVYQVKDNVLIVLVLAVDKREDDEVYLSAEKRLGLEGTSKEI